MTPLRVDGKVVYNWEGGVVHPYVTAGVGAFNTPLATFNEGSYWSIDFGLKGYLRP